MHQTIAPTVSAPRRRKRISWGRMGIHTTLMTLSILFLLPLLIVISASLSSESAIGKYGFSLIPRDITLAAYQYLFYDPSQIIGAYGVTIVVTVVGTSLGVLVMAMLGYALSRADFAASRPLSFFVFFTILFNGGLVPTYILVTNYLHLTDTLGALILPYLVVPWFVLLLRTYFKALPRELIEAAKIDGAGEIYTFFRIVVPLSTPALATIALFSALLYWNDWFLGLLYINDPRLTPLQLLLYRISNNITFLASHPQVGHNVAIPTLTVQMAMAIIAIGPIIFAFLFVQKYFVRGITLGGLKGD